MATRVQRVCCRPDARRAPVRRRWVAAVGVALLLAGTSMARGVSPGTATLNLIAAGDVRSAASDVVATSVLPEGVPAPEGGGCTETPDGIVTCVGPDTAVTSSIPAGVDPASTGTALTAATDETPAARGWALAALVVAPVAAALLALYLIRRSGRGPGQAGA